MLTLSSVASLATGLLGELVSPTRCAACDERVRPRVLFCPACAVSVEKADRWAPRSGYSCVFDYGGAVATAITLLKYRGRSDLGARLGAVMAEEARHLASAVDVVIPVPLHARRLAERGYNQSALIAEPVARRIGALHLPCALDRVRDTPRQTALPRAPRLANLRKAFAVRKPGFVRGCRVLLVDDVRTTGATLEACAEALDRAGVRQILAFVLASPLATPPM
jgi:ComF family protein